MRQEICQQSIAWFKFAELVARKEKERAMAIFRLLSLSWNDQGYAHLLKGDLLRAFHDEEGAREAYRRAVWYYDEAKRPQAALDAYERLFASDSTNASIVLAIIARGVSLNHSRLVVRYCTTLRTLAALHTGALLEELLSEALADFPDKSVLLAQWAEPLSDAAIAQAPTVTAAVLCSRA